MKNQTKKDLSIEDCKTIYERGGLKHREFYKLSKDDRLKLAIYTGLRVGGAFEQK